MTTSTALILKDTTLGPPVIAPSAQKAKADALAVAQPVKKVENDGDLKIAVDALRELKGIRQGMETARKAVKAPVLELGKKIDAVAYDFVTETDREENRIQGLINHYQRKVMEAQREAERALQRKKEEAAQLEAAAQKQRETAELAVEPGAKNAAEREAAKLEEQAQEVALDAELEAGPIALQNPKGLVMQSKLNFEITDAVVFCQAYPDFWAWHADTETLKLKRREILDELNCANGKGLFHTSRFPEELPDQKGSRIAKPAGMRIFEETKSHIR